MIEPKMVEQCVALAETLPERYRDAGFSEFLRYALRRNEHSGVASQPASSSGVPSEESSHSVAALAKLLTTSTSNDQRILAAARILELEGEQAPLLSDLPIVFRRFRVKAPGNISRDAAKLIHRGALLEHGRDGRRVRIVLSNQGLTELAQRGYE